MSASAKSMAMTIQWGIQIPMSVRLHVFIKILNML